MPGSMRNKHGVHHERHFIPPERGEVLVSERFPDPLYFAVLYPFA